MTNRVTITLHIDLPDGVVPDVGYSTMKVAVPPPIVALDEPPPPYDRDEQVAEFPPFPVQPACRDHGPMRRYPAGTNKAGKPYNASWRCATAGCTTKPVWDKDAA